MFLKLKCFYYLINVIIQFMYHLLLFLYKHFALILLPNLLRLRIWIVTPIDRKQTPLPDKNKRGFYIKYDFFVH